MRSKAVFGIMQILLLIEVLPLVLDVQLVDAAISPYSPAGGIKLVPSSVVGFCSSDLYPGPNNTKFDVTVVIWNITGCAGFALWIDYNSTLLALDSWTFDTDPANPLSPTQMAPPPTGRYDTDSSVPGSVKIATVWKAATPLYTYSGDSVVARLTFQIIYIPPPLMGENNTVSTLLVLHQTLGCKAVDDIGDLIFFAVFGDGYYEYTTRERLVGDVDGDRDVDVGDQRKVQLAMFSVPGDPNWNPNMDVEGDLDVDVGDQRKQQLHMFESW